MNGIRVERGRDGVACIEREVDRDAVVQRVAMTLDDGEYLVSWFDSNGEFSTGWKLTTDWSPLTEAEAREALGPLLEPGGMPWPWWVRLPYFAGHLRGE